MIINNCYKIECTNEGFDVYFHTGKQSDKSILVHCDTFWVIRSVEKLPEHEVYGVIQQDVRVAIQNVMSNEQIINTLANYGQYIKPEN